MQRSARLSLRIAPLAGIIPLGDEIISRTTVLLPVGLFNIVGAGAGWEMELLRIGIEYIVSLYGADARRFRLLRLLRSNGRAGLLRNRGAAGGEVAVPGSIVDGDARLDIVGIDARTGYPRRCPRSNTPPISTPLASKLLPSKMGRYPIEHVVVRLLDVVCHHILEGEHPFNVQVPSAGDQVLLVGILAR